MSNGTYNPASQAISAALECSQLHPLRQYAVELLLGSLRDHRGSVTTAAEELETTRQAIQTWLRESRGSADAWRRDLWRGYQQLRRQFPAVRGRAARGKKKSTS